MTRNSTVLLPLRDKNIHGDPWIVRDHKTEIFIFFKGTDQRLIGMVSTPLRLSLLSGLLFRFH